MKNLSLKIIAAVAGICILLGWANVTEAGLLSSIDPLHHYLATHDPIGKIDPAMQYLFGDDEDEDKGDKDSKGEKGGGGGSEEKTPEEVLNSDPQYCTSVLKNIAVLSSAIDITTAKLKEQQDKVEKNKLRLAQLSATSSTSVVASTTAPLSITVNPKTAKAGDVVTIFGTINSAIDSYSLEVKKDSTVIDTISSAEKITSSARPFQIQKSFKISQDAPLGKYFIRLFNSSGDVQADLTILGSDGATVTPTFSTTTVATTTVPAAPTVISFINPFAYSKIKQGKATTISWTYQGNSAGTVNLYVTAKCVKSVRVCSKATAPGKVNTCPIVKSKCTVGAVTKTLIARNIRVTRSSVTWKVPPKYADKQILISAEQSGKRIGISQPIFVSK